VGTVGSVAIEQVFASPFGGVDGGACRQQSESEPRTLNGFQSSLTINGGGARGRGTSAGNGGSPRAESGQRRGQNRGSGDTAPQVGYASSNPREPRDSHAHGNAFSGSQGSTAGEPEPASNEQRRPSGNDNDSRSGGSGGSDSDGGGSEGGDSGSPGGPADGQSREPGIVIFRFLPPADPAGVQGGGKSGDDLGAKLPPTMSEWEYRVGTGELDYLRNGAGAPPLMKKKTGADDNERVDLPTSEPSRQPNRDLEGDLPARDWLGGGGGAIDEKAFNYDPQPFMGPDPAKATKAGQADQK
jgi:hypothetical protein